MIVENIELRAQPSLVASHGDPVDCDHLWEPHLWETCRAYCSRCGSFACWVNDPRAREEIRP